MVAVAQVSGEIALVVVGALGRAVLPFFAFGFLLPKWLGCFSPFSWLKASFGRRWVFPVVLGSLLSIVGLATVMALEATRGDQDAETFLQCWWILILVDLLLCIGWVRHASRRPMERTRDLAAKVVSIGLETKQKALETKQRAEKWIAQQSDRFHKQ